MVDGNKIVLVKGTSGAGKSTRVYLFIYYLESIGIKLEPFKFKNINGEEHVIGLYSEDMNMVFVGKFYENGGVRRWQGYDSVTGRIGSADGLTFFLKEMTRLGHSVLIDGAGTTATYRLRPIELCGDCGYTNILHIRYYYQEDQKDEYMDRLVYRSGKLPKSDAMWRKNFEGDYLKAVEEAKDVNEAGGNVVVQNKLYNVPEWDTGEEIFKFFEMPELCNDFIEFCKKVDYTKQNSFNTFENGKK